MSLEVRNLTKRYGKKEVVSHISFTMDKPGVFALLGTNGAGKTTSIRMILGMLAKDEGEVTWNGKPLDPLEINVGYLAEERGLYPKYALMDQMMYFAKLKNVDTETAKKRIAYWVKHLELQEYFYPKPVGKRPAKPMKAEQLSKGNQQKVQLMAALISDPELIVLDEPLSGLDPVNSDLFKEVIRNLIKQNKYVIMSSHQMEVIEEFCEDIIILHHGNSVVQGNLNEIKKSYGRVNVSVKCEGDIDKYIEELGIKVMEKTPEGYLLKVTGDEMAENLLKNIMSAGIRVVRFEMREPSLHEIFVEKATSLDVDNTGAEAVSGGNNEE
ncbi:MAG: ATP-binding cassette domain-containing protein [Lachnospiraceae bacterium]|nr:ATP-binding cassette domain-containing protein [Lachnospiraceae bacterium]